MGAMNYWKPTFRYNSRIGRKGERVPERETPSISSAIRDTADRPDKLIFQTVEKLNGRAFSIQFAWSR